MMKLTNIKYQIIPSKHKQFVEVAITYKLDNVSHPYFIFIPKQKKWSDEQYIEEAKKRFAIDYESGKVLIVSKGDKKRNWLIGATAFFGIATLVLAGLFILKYFAEPTTPGGGGDDPSSDIKINFDEQSKGLTIYPATADKDTDYVGTITVTSENQAIKTNDVTITINEEELVFGQDYTLSLKGLNEETNRYEYELKINADKMNANVSINAPSINIDAFKVTEATKEAAFAFNDVEYMQLYLHYFASSAKPSYDDEVQFAPNVYHEVTNDFYHSDRYIIIPDSSPNADPVSIEKHGITNMFTKMHSLVQPYTPETFSLHQQIKIILGNALLYKIDGNLIFNPDKLSYECNEPITYLTITINKACVMFENNLPSTIEIDMTQENSPSHYIITYNYNEDDIELPSNHDIFNPLDNTHEIDKATQWVPVFNELNQLDNLAFTSNDSLNRFENDKYYVTLPIEEEPGEFESFYYAKEEVSPNEIKYYKYSKDDDDKWFKEEILQEEFDKYSLQKIKNDLSLIANNPDYFTYNPSENEYVSNDDAPIDPYKSISAVFNVCTSLDGTNKEIVLSTTLFEDDVNIQNHFSFFIKDGSVHVYLPVIED